MVSGLKRFCLNNLLQNSRKIWPFSKNRREILHFFQLNSLGPNYISIQIQIQIQIRIQTYT